MLSPVVAALTMLPSATVIEPDAAFDHERFSAAAHDVERQSNADRGKWLDDYTRHDGMTVDCVARAVELKLYVAISFNQIPGNWQDRLRFTWSSDYCGDAAWAASITHHWSVTLTISSAAGEIFVARADCH